jgi:hypothetical protein
VNGSVLADEALFDEALVVSPLALDEPLAFVVPVGAPALVVPDEPPGLPVWEDPPAPATLGDGLPPGALDDPDELELPEDGAEPDAAEELVDPDPEPVVADVVVVAFASGSMYWLSPADVPGPEASAVFGPSTPSTANTAQQTTTRTHLRTTRVLQAMPLRAFRHLQGARRSPDAIPLSLGPLLGSDGCSPDSRSRRTVRTVTVVLQ